MDYGVPRGNANSLRQSLFEISKAARFINQELFARLELPLNINEAFVTILLATKKHLYHEMYFSGKSVKTKKREPHIIPALEPSYFSLSLGQTLSFPFSLGIVVVIMH